MGTLNGTIRQVTHHTIGQVWGYYLPREWGGWQLVSPLHTTKRACREWVETIHAPRVAKVRKVNERLGELFAEMGGN